MHAPSAREYIGCRIFLYNQGRRITKEKEDSVKNLANVVLSVCVQTGGSQYLQISVAMYLSSSISQWIHISEAPCFNILVSPDVRTSTSQSLRTCVPYLRISRVRDFLASTKPVSILITPLIN